MILEGWLYCNLVGGVAMFGGVEPWARAILELSWVLLAATALARGKMSAAAVPPLAIGCAGVAGLAAWQAATGNTASVWATRNAVALWAMAACAAWCGAALIATRRALRRAVMVLFVTALACEVEGLMQKGRVGHAIYGLRPAPSAFGPFYNRDHAAGFMAAGAALGLGLLAARVARFLSRRRTVGRTADLWAGQVILASLVGSLGAGMAAAGSRGATHGLLAGAGLVCYLGARRFATGPARRALLAGVLIAAAGYAGLVTVLPKFAGWVEQEQAFDASTQARFAIWRLSAGLAREHPAFGRGVGAFRYAFAPVQIDEPILSAGRVEHAHSDWLQFLVEGGITGFALIVVALGWQMWRQFRQWRRDEDLEVWGLLGGALAAVATLAVHTMVDFDLQMPGLLAVFVAAASWFYPLRPFPWPRAVRLVAAGAVLAGLAVCAGRAARTGWAWNLQRVALTEDLGGRIWPLSRALKLDPGNPAAARDLGVAYLWMADEVHVASLIYTLKARAIAEAALAGTPDEPGLLEIRAAALARLHRTREAREARARAQALQPWIKPVGHN